MTNRPLDEEAIFHIARDLSDIEKRAAYLDQVCAGDPALRERVEGLLRAYEEEQGFLKSNNRVASTVASSEIGKDAHQQIGPYKIREQIGEGGMGIVYVAEQQTPVKRKVALKVIKPGMDSKEVVARFEAERQALAMMDHPGIAKVFDGGVTETGQPYFAMELINGIPITGYCDEQKLGIRERLELFIAVCHAVQHAHQKGVIHRDIKPNNVLVTLHDGKPVPVVIDFGVAKATNQNLTDQTIYTRLHQVVGTTLYMSPEQAELSRFGVDTRADIYSLGVLLYEMLAGTTPFDPERFKQAALDEVRRIIREEEPPKPSTRLSTLGENATRVSSLRRTDPQKLRHSLRGDLDWIVMMTLEKDRNRRYKTANGLAMDVERFLNKEPILARPPSTLYRMQKFYSRNKALTTTSFLIILSLATGLSLAIWAMNEANIAKQEALEATETAESERGNAIQATKIAEIERDEKVELADRLNEQVYRESMRLARNLFYENNLTEVEQILHDNRDRPLVKNGEDFNWYSLWKECDDANRSHAFKIDQAVSRVDCHPTKNLIVVSDWIGQVYLFELLDNGFKEVWKETRDDDQVRPGPPAFVDNGNFIFFPVLRETLHGNEVKEVLFRFVSTDNPLVKFDLETGIQTGIGSSCCTNSLELIAFADSEGRINVWKFDSIQRTIDRLTDDPIMHDHRVGSMHGGMDFCPTNPSLLMTRHVDNQIFFNQIDSTVGDTEPRPIQVESSVWDIEWSPDGSKLLTGHFDKNARIIDVESGQVEETIAGYHQDEIYSVAWSADGRLVATGGRDGVVRVFDAEALRLIDTLRFHSGLIYTLDFTADWKGNTWLLAGTRSNALWATPVNELRPNILELNAEIHEFGILPDNQTLAAMCKTSDDLESTTSNDHESIDHYRLEFFNLGNGRQPTKILQESYRTGAFSDGNLFAGLTETGRLQVVDLNTAKVIGEQDLGLSSKALICFSFDETLLAVIDQSNHKARFYSVPDLEQQDWVLDLKSKVGNCAISCDNNRLAVGRDYGYPIGLDAIEVFDIHTGSSILRDDHNRDSIGWYDLKFSPTNKDVLAAGDWDGRLHVWGLSSSIEPIVINSHLGTLRSLDFSREGSVLYTSGSEGTIKAWRVPKCEPMSTFRLYEDQNISVYGAAFSKDRSILAARHRYTGRIHLIRAASPDDVKMSTWWNAKRGK